MSTEAFFAFARERHAIHLRRAAGLPRHQWTSDPILSRYRFTNVFRELDRTTVWFREHVRDPLRDRPEVLLATVLFRWFNRIQTGEAIFLQGDLIGGGSCTAWESHLNHSDGRGGATGDLRRAILSYCGKGPYVTGSYIIKTPDGRNKLDGVLWCVEQFTTQRRCMPGITGTLDWREVSALEADACLTLEMMWGWLRQFPYMGDFMAYEVVTDLRHTALLDRSHDIMTWANPGPGAMRGLNRVFRDSHILRPDTRHDYPAPSLRMHYIGEMRALLEASRNPDYWPRASVRRAAEHGLVAGDWWNQLSLSPDSRSWPAWEMRDVEHTLCEFDKYERARLGEGRPRGVYR